MEHFTHFTQEYSTAFQTSFLLGFFPVFSDRFLLVLFPFRLPHSPGRTDGRTDGQAEEKTRQTLTRSDVRRLPECWRQWRGLHQFHQCGTIESHSLPPARPRAHPALAGAAPAIPITWASAGWGRWACSFGDHRGGSSNSAHTPAKISATFCDSFFC